MALDGPIFIVGAPRSGTSFLRVTLNRHPAIELCDETAFFYKVWVRRQAFGDLAIPENRQRLISRYIETSNVKALGVDRELLAQRLMRDGTNYQAFFTTLVRQGALERGKARFGEKMPHLALFSETLCDWYPRCALIHIVRDPRDVVASLKRMPFGSPEALANALTWLEHVGAARRVEHRDNYLLVKYEELVREPEAELRHIFAFIGERYAPSTLEAREPAREVTWWWYERAQGSLQRDRVGIWQDQLDRSEVRLIEWIAGPTMKALGYECEAEKPSLLTKGAALARTCLHYLLIRASNPGTLWCYWMQPTNLASDDSRGAFATVGTRWLRRLFRPHSDRAR